MAGSLDHKIAEVARVQHGAFTVRQALDIGFSRTQIATRREKGRWLIRAPRTYVVAGAPGSFEQDAWVTLLACPNGAVMSHLAAAFMLGAIDGPPETIDATLPWFAHRPRLPGVRVHRARTLERRDIRRVSGLAVTCPARTLSDGATILDRPHLEALLDATLERGLATPRSVRNYISDRSLVSRPGGALLGRLLADRESGVPGGELERLFIRLVRRERLPIPQRQFKIGNRRVDFAYARQRIVIELDGLSHHRSKATFIDDRRRQNDLVLQGWLVLRFTWDDLTAREQEVIEKIKAALCGRR